jgi:hypothetical protein
MTEVGSVDILPVRESEEGFFDCASRPEIEKARFPEEKKPPGRSAQNDRAQTKAKARLRDETASARQARARDEA